MVRCLVMNEAESAYQPKYTTEEYSQRLFGRTYRLAILLAVSEQDGVCAKEIAESIEAPLNSIHVELESLEELGYLEPQPRQPGDHHSTVRFVRNPDKDWGNIAGLAEYTIDSFD